MHSKLVAPLLIQLAFCSCAVAQKDSDLSIPVFDPKPVVWIDDWKPREDDSTPRRDKANRIVRIADQLKSARQYEQAESAYRLAIRTDPSWPYPPYQLACNYELWGKTDKSEPEFQKALELGFSDFPTALGDDELGELRKTNDFSKTLGEIRSRYIRDTKDRIGTPVAIKPDGEKPEKGWPLILLLHGYGDSNVNYIGLAKKWAELGYVAVAVPGSIPNQTGGFIWGLKSTDQTLEDLRAITSSDLIKQSTNPDHVFLLGFSQGALHSLLLAAEHRDEFKGVVALSPGGSIAQQMLDPKISEGTPGRLVFIHGSEEVHAPIALLWKRACLSMRWKFKSSVHEGGHHFPRDWEEQRPSIAKFLLQ